MDPTKNFIVAVFLLCLILYSSVNGLRCEPIRMQMCANMQWNMTSIPNLLHQTSQQNAQLSLEQYEPLVQTNCSVHLHFFLCAMYAPMCNEEFQTEPIPPCRDVCERAKLGCDPYLEMYNHTWPESLDCSQLPVYDTHVCIRPEAFVGSNNRTGEGGPDGFTSSEVLVKTVEIIGIKKKCECKKLSRFHMRKYVRRNFDYVIKAKIEGVASMGGKTILTLNIRKVFKNRSRLPLKRNSTMMIWTQSQCRTCSLAKANREYIMACHQDIRSGRLMFDANECMVSRWKPRWANTIKQWDEIANIADSGQRTIRMLEWRSSRRRARTLPEGGRAEQGS